jgi:hypothetical protein
VLVIGEGFVECVPGDAGGYRADGLVAGEGDQPDRQCPAAARPGRVVGRQDCAECVPGSGGQVGPPAIRSQPGFSLAPASSSGTSAWS